MGIKSKNRIGYYLNQLWLIELIFTPISLVLIFSDMTKERYNVDNSLIYRTLINGYRSNRLNYILILLYILFVIFDLIKIMAICIKQKGLPKIRGNFIGSVIYVFRYGFRFKQSAKALIVSFILSIILFIGYLYLLAVGGYQNNLIVSFFSRYPFKASFALVILPMIGVTFSIKKSIDILLVCDSLKEINKGNLDYEIQEQGCSEIRELSRDIIKIQDGYKIALQGMIKNEKLKTELISNVSHDLRTPLTSIINYVNILRDSELTEEERGDFLEILDQKSKKLKGLIDDLFEMSKINSGKMQLVKERLEIMSLIHQVIGECSYLYEHKNIEFIVSNSKEEYFMELDGKLMSRVLQNVVVNALKYSLENTRVYVDVTEDDNNIIISVKNIANYAMDFNKDEIFERFVRGDNSRNSKVEGSGLGLAITKSIIELHNGNVEIVTEGDMFKIFIILQK